ncbi:hypothetical protein Nepgr_023569 [Nepenthes gracilis]|uniref:Uncharacterized protein n=1 Tax=Nepenthes gracilis TaxID=150966 RepID=A0AAD3T2S0_NEPGR|nr:hypothetical protein Nepgr_023569 [Nepenthes gracilis]
MSISGLTNLFTNPNPNSFSISKITNNKFNVNYGVRPRVSVRTKDCEVKQVANLESKESFYGQFSATVKPSSPMTSPSSKQSKEDEERQSYYVNMGYAIRCLREEIPELFCRDLSFDIYRDDIVFKDPINTFIGIENYKSIFWALRFHGRIFFRALWVDIVSVWQPVESVILIRWTAHGIPRIPWESHGRFDGISEYKLDKKGKIYEHKVDNIALNSHRKFRVLAVEELIQSLGCPSTPKPTCFEISSSPVVRFVPLMVTLSWLMHYLNSAIDLSLRNDAESSPKS